MTTPSGFIGIANCLRDWPEVPVPEVRDEPHLERLGACLVAKREGQSVGWSDIAVLVRQALRADARREDPLATSLMVPAGDGWPSEEQWHSCGVLSDVVGSRQLRLRAQPWKPEWLTDRLGDGVDSMVALAAREDGLRRSSENVPADPFLRATFPKSSTDFSTYTSQAHQQAVRTVMSCKPGATIFVNLPTGAGKSTVALAPAFARGKPVGVSLMVVPTVALALDQERRVHELLDDDSAPFAYTHATDEGIRRGIRASIRAGTQTVLFVSPESITRSLAPALFHAAQKGHLRYFVVDEAHLVDQWGTEFRPEFQAMAGLRTELMRVQRESGVEGFRTILMTATLTPAAADLLDRLFGQPGPIESAISNLLRPEPSYWTAEFDGWEHRMDGVVEALRHLPRPAVVFTTRPPYAESLLERVRKEGFARVASFTGSTADKQRRSVLAAFRQYRIDLVIATSAFGLGVDQSDVRTIIHACIPETIDRYYQEVGRGGRDGRTSMSLVCWTSGDKKDAWGLAKPRVIGQELGLDRWRDMFSKGERLASGYRRLTVSGKPLRIDTETEANEKWNIRTLGLLARAGLIEFGWDEESTLRFLEEDQTESKGDFKEGRDLYVRLLYGAIDEAVWDELVEPVRESVNINGRLAHDLMMSALSTDAATCQLIAQAYDLSRMLNHHVSHHGPPAVVCGGCPAHPSGRVAGFQPLVWPAKHPLDPGIDGLKSLTGAEGVAVVTYPPPRLPRDRAAFHKGVAEALRLLVPRGTRVVIAPDEVLGSRPLSHLLTNLHQVIDDRTLFVQLMELPEDLQLDLLPQLPMVFILPPEVRLMPPTWLEVLDSDPPRVLVASEDSMHPERPDRLLRDLHASTVRLDRFVAGGGI